MCGLSQASQWQPAQALYVIGSLSANIVTAFYAATFPGLVRDLPRLIQSEKDVQIGAKTYVSARVVLTWIAPMSTPSWICMKGHK